MPREFGPTPEEMGINQENINTNNQNSMENKKIHHINMLNPTIDSNKPTISVGEPTINVSGPIVEMTPKTEIPDINKPKRKEEEILETTPKEYAKLLVELVNTGLENKPKTIKDLRDYEPLIKLREGLKKSDNPAEQELSGILEKKIEDTDYVTDLPRKDVQNGIIKNVIYERIKEGNLKESAKNIGLVSFDLRSLKAVNDASSDHTIGDSYLRRVSNFVRNDFKPKLKEMLGEGVKVSIARDGGDEFSILLIADGINLNQNLYEKKDQNEKTKALFKHPEIKIIMEETGKVNLMEIISELLSRKLSAENQNIIFLSAEEQDEYDRIIAESAQKKLGAESQNRMEELEKIAKEKMQKTFYKHINKDREKDDPILEVPEEFDFCSHVAAGGATLDEIINKSTEEDFKKFNKIETGDKALEKLMGALRTRSDHKSYQEKDHQNNEMLDSNKSTEQFRMILASRNEYTTSLTKRIIELKKELKRCIENNI